MIREVFSNLDYGTFAVVALLLFVIAFGMIIVRTFTTKPETLDQQAGIPLSDGVRSQHHES